MSYLQERKPDEPKDKAASFELYYSGVIEKGDVGEAQAALGQQLRERELQDLLRKQALDPHQPVHGPQPQVPEPR